MKNLDEILKESLLDDDIEDQYSPDKVADEMLWQELCGSQDESYDAITKLLNYCRESKCKVIKIPKNARDFRHNGRIKVDPDKYYIYFNYTREEEGRLIALGKGNEPMYTFDIPRNPDHKYKSIPTRFINLRSDNITQDMSVVFKVKLMECPKDLVWLYERLKKEVKNKS